MAHPGKHWSDEEISMLLFMHDEEQANPRTYSRREMMGQILLYRGVVWLDGSQRDAATISPEHVRRALRELGCETKSKKTPEQIDYGKMKGRIIPQNKAFPTGVPRLHNSPPDLDLLDFRILGANT